MWNVMTKFHVKILCSNCISSNNDHCLIDEKSLVDIPLEVLKFKQVNMKTSCINAVIKTKDPEYISNKIFDKYPDRIRQIIINKKLL